MPKPKPKPRQQTHKPRSPRQAQPEHPPSASAGMRTRQLLQWYREHGRDLPWRRTRDPYRILVSEVMCQQTQVDRVVPFYECFLMQFPDERALSAASLDAIHRAWKGLGYPNRVERLQRACQEVLSRGGRWPDTVETLQELPGIGPYTAGAVACFAFAAATTVVDTNVARVYVRHDALVLPIAKDVLWAHVAREVHAGDPIPWNNALMELGALVCTARAPRCTVCPWSATCGSRADPQRLDASSNPLKVATPRIRYGETITDRTLPRQHIVLGLIHDQDRYLVARRPRVKHAGGAWELPGGKREPGEDERTALARELHEELGVEVLSARKLMDFSHAYPDRYLTFHVYRVRLFDPAAARPRAAEELRWVSPQEFVALEFPPANAAIQRRMRRYHHLPS
jgi:A/G-specific adenine glycosylase